MLPRVIGGAYRLEDVVVASPSIARGRDLRHDTVVDVTVMAGPTEDCSLLLPLIPR